MKKIDFDESSPLQSYAHRWLEKKGFLDESAPFIMKIIVGIRDFVNKIANA